MASTTNQNRGCGWAAVLLAAAMAVAQAHASEGRGSGFLYLEEPLNPRLVAMGSAGTALSDAGFFYYNPASASHGGSSYLSVQYGQQTGDLRRAGLEASIILGNWFVAAAVPTTAVTGIVPATETGPNEATPFSAQGTQLSLAGGWFNERVAAGLCLNGLQDRIETHVSYGFSLSAGVLCWILPGRLSAGAAAFHPNGAGSGAGRLRLATTRGALDGTDTWGSGPALPTSERAGVAWSDTMKGLPYAAALDVVLRNEDNRLMVPVGVEVLPLKFLAVRAGKRFNHDTEIMNFGLGLRMAPVSADAGFVISRLVDDADFKWLINVTYSLNHLLPAKAAK